MYCISVASVVNNSALENQASGLWGEWGMREDRQNIWPCLILTLDGMMTMTSITVCFWWTGLRMSWVHWRCNMLSFSRAFCCLSGQLAAPCSPWAGRKTRCLWTECLEYLESIFIFLKNTQPSSCRAQPSSRWKSLPRNHSFEFELRCSPPEAETARDSCSTNLAAKAAEARVFGPPTNLGSLRSLKE